VVGFGTMSGPRRMVPRRRIILPCCTFTVHARKLISGMGRVRLLAQKDFNAISSQRDFELARFPAVKMFLATNFKC